jgi:hypothetical protein
MDEDYGSRQGGDSGGSLDIDSKLVYIGVSAVVIFGLVFLVGRAWKKSQKA